MAKMKCQKEKTFGENIRFLRQQNRWTAKELILRCERFAYSKKFFHSLLNGFSASYVSKIERQHEIPSPEAAFFLGFVLTGDSTEAEALLKISKSEKVVRVMKDLDQRYDVEYFSKKVL